MIRVPVAPRPRREAEARTGNGSVAGGGMRMTPSAMVDAGGKIEAVYWKLGTCQLTFVAAAGWIEPHLPPHEQIPPLQRSDFSLFHGRPHRLGRTGGSSSAQLAGTGGLRARIRRRFAGLHRLAQRPPLPQPEERILSLAKRPRREAGGVFCFVTGDIAAGGRAVGRGAARMFCSQDVRSAGDEKDRSDDGPTYSSGDGVCHRRGRNMVIRWTTDRSSRGTGIIQGAENQGRCLGSFPAQSRRGRRGRDKRGCAPDREEAPARLRKRACRRSSERPDG